MQSEHKILTTHVGALPSPHDLWSSTGVDDARLKREVAEIVKFQRGAGVDIVNEGELTKGGNWVGFVNTRLTGFEERQLGTTAALLRQSQDWVDFAEFYKDAAEGGTLFETTRRAPEQMRRSDWACVGPVTYCGQALLDREIETLKGALGDTPPSMAFLTSTAPASIEPGRLNEYYKTEEEFVWALAEALSVEYEAIAKAGFQVQVDDAWLAALWDRIGIPMGMDGYKKYCTIRIDALNHALRNIPEEQIRYHLCWGSWHGPHSRDIEMRDMIDLLLRVKAGTYLFEAANARHEHEFSIWHEVKAPEHKVLAPGVVSHATTLIEHPELVALRIRRFTDIVGRERVIASTDCGLGLRCHPQVAWAKLVALSEGAAIASSGLWKAAA